MPEGRVLAIGDVHGCFRSLMALIKAVQVSPQDRLIFLGDYTDRGLDSNKVLQWLIDQKDHLPLITLRGNHEIMMMAARQEAMAFHYWTTYGGAETMASYEAETQEDLWHMVPPDHWQFIEATKPWYETETHIFVHAGANAELDMPQQDEDDLYWNRFETVRPHRSGKIIVCGHTAQASGQIADAGHAICIDTAACRGRWLTCLDVQKRWFWQANEMGMTRSDFLAPRVPNPG